MLRFLGLAGIWGASFLFIKLALEGMTPPQIVLGRILGGALVLVIVLKASGKSLPRERSVWGHLFVLAVTANVVPFFLFAWAESGDRVTSGLAGVINGITPLLTLLIAIAALPEERATATRVVGLILGFTGVVLIVGPWREGMVGGEITGILACLGAAVCYGGSINYTRRFVSGRSHPPVVLACGQLLLATVLQGTVVAVSGRQPMHLDAGVVLSILALGLLGTGVAYLLFYALIEEVGATTASMVTYLIPVVAVILGVAILDEPVTWNLFAGAVVVILGVGLAEGRLGPNRHRPSIPEPVTMVPATSTDASP